jgi:PqqD family protein of HPr-rel-A system
MSFSPIWHVASPSVQVRRHWAGEDEWAVFNARSGDVHLLNAGAIRLLDRLIASPASIAELCVALNISDREQMAHAIEQLDRLGLVQPFSS